jgi:hypothetical protein
MSIILSCCYVGQQIPQKQQEQSRKALLKFKRYVLINEWGNKVIAPDISVALMMRLAKEI